MRLTSLLPALAMSATLLAQSPLSMPFTANNGNSAGGVVYFNITVVDPNGITITALDVNTGTTVVGTPGTINVFTGPATYVGNTGTAAPWVQVASGPVIAGGNNLPSPVCLGAGAFFAPGTYGVAINNVGVAQRYTNGNGTAVPGSGTNQSGATAELTLAAGAAANTLFNTPTPNQPRVWNGNIYYNVGNVPGLACAGRTTFGAGCYAAYQSFYQLFPSATTAGPGLTGNSMQLTPTASGYTGSWGGGAFLAPSGGAVNLFAAATDDGEVNVLPSIALPTPQGPQATLRIHSNGLVSWGAAAQTFPGTNNFTPTSAGFLGAANAGIWSWHDYNEAELGSGRIVREEVVVGPDTVLVVTWNGVENYASPEVANPSTMQMQMNLTTGVVTLVWQSIDGNATSAFGSAHLVGYSPAGASGDPGSVDLATALPISSAASEQSPLTLNSNLPRLGTNWVMTSTSFDALSPIGVQFFGTGSFPGGISLAGVGAPGCSAYQSADLGGFTFPVAAQTGTYTIAVPVTPALAGVVLHTQSAGLTLANALGLNTSNGLTGTVGN